jgi:hypothetical protein
MNQLLPNESRADAAKTLMKINLFIIITFCLLNVFYIRLAMVAINGEVMSYDLVTLIDTFSTLVGVINIIVFILTAVTFIQWFRRAYYNLHLQNISWLRWKEGWAAGAWFVPIISLYVPYQIMKDIWSATLYKIQKKNDTSEFSSEIIGWWWAAFLCSNIISNVQTQLNFRGYGENPDGFLILQYMDLFSNLIAIAGAIFAVNMISKYTKMESLMHEMNENEDQEH